MNVILQAWALQATLAVVALGALGWYLKGWKRSFAVVGIFVAVFGSHLMIERILGNPRPIEWSTIQKAEIHGIYYGEDMIGILAGNPAIYYSMLWTRKRERLLRGANDEATRRGGNVRLWGERTALGDWMFYPDPPPAMPPKQ